MSKLNVDSDGFQKVITKRCTKNKPTKIICKEQFKKEEIAINIELAKRRIITSKQELSTSTYFEQVQKILEDIVKAEKVTEIVCFGLGHIGECRIARYQLAFLLCLKDILKPEQVIVHDPIFYVDECAVLKQLELQLIKENSEGSYIISDQNTTLVYLPHCPKQLTNNFLWSNWSAVLEKCILICNSFGSLVENQPSRVLTETVPYISKIAPYITEVGLENNFNHTDIFNDTSVHYFLNENLEKLGPDFWVKGNKPEYNNTEEFITSLMIDKLNI